MQKLLEQIVAGAVGLRHARRDRRLEHVAMSPPGRQAAVQPPSTISDDPVTSADASEAR